MKKTAARTVVLLAFSAYAGHADAQFNTISDKRKVNFEYIQPPVTKVETTDSKQDTTILIDTKPQNVLHKKQEANDRIFSLKKPLRKKHLDFDYRYSAFPDLTLNNLLMEIRKNGIQYENVVLAQAILETGWFTSSVCQNKRNLFGLTNPRTGEYYEFDRWQDSVKAYYTKVQYKYKGGNYLLWLDRLPYAESTTYILSLINLLKQYFI